MNGENANGNNTIKFEKTETGYDLGTFNFLRAGWWIWHIIAILGIFYLGWVFGGAIF
ncbi:hypothetical protein SAMN02745221_00990 [Thermosyntropha lipolytica DSM 11003]|uniref:Uncharacterized protein n=1 Tax=Thermosyntropha lipolytica DSM 11003 TaxID=1123382 RepID=A0A1M5MT37_9FIRM|nr:hypothetical protein [Thermosyntropha lipolytica]SHG79953.1 hypothetical protein SAMN02745221_00990 [Thermosyntropha lipolytica DSM 11003]